MPALGRAQGKVHTHKGNAQMQAQRKARAEANKAKVEAWYKEFDIDHTVRCARARLPRQPHTAAHACGCASRLLLLPSQGLLSRDQLKALLKHLTGTDPTEKALDMMMEKAITLDTNGDGKPDAVGISKSSALTTVEARWPCCSKQRNRLADRSRPVCAPQKYVDYAKEQVVLDAIFDEFDTDKSGKLNEDQARTLGLFLC